MGSGGKAKERGTSDARERKRDKAREDALKRLEGEGAGRGACRLGG
jgi:hypothetical protein